MDDNNEKKETFMDNVLTIAGAACLMYPLIRQATKTLIPEMEKLTSDESLQELKLLPYKEKRHDISEPKDIPEYDIKRDEERKSHENEVAELKRKLAEIESKSGEHKSEY